MAVVTNAPIDVPLDPVRVAGAQEAGRLLESLGHQVEEAQAPWSDDSLLRAFTALFAPLVTLQIAFGRLVHGREPEEHEMEPLSWGLWQLVRGMSALDTHLASAQLQIFAPGPSELDGSVRRDRDTGPGRGAGGPDDVHWQTDDPMGLFTRSGAFTPFTAVANVTGQPAIALPLDEHEGLPVGVPALRTTGARRRPAGRRDARSSRRRALGAAAPDPLRVSGAGGMASRPARPPQG